MLNWGAILLSVCGWWLHQDSKNAINPQKPLFTCKLKKKKLSCMDCQSLTPTSQNLLFKKKNKIYVRSNNWCGLQCSIFQEIDRLVCSWCISTSMETLVKHEYMIWRFWIWCSTYRCWEVGGWNLTMNRRTIIINDHRCIYSLCFGLALVLHSAGRAECVWRSMRAWSIAACAVAAV